MKRVRILSIAIFLIALAISSGYKFLEESEMDNMGPVISMPADTVYISTSADKSEILEGVIAEDNEDGDVTDSLVIESMTNFIEPGRREVTIAAFDSHNNVSKITREVIYTDYESPKFYLSSPLYFPINSTTSFVTSMSATDVLDGDLTESIKVSADYKATMDIEGEYQILFTVSNSAGDVSKLPVTVTLYDAAKSFVRPYIELTEYLIYVEKGNVIDPWLYVKGATYRGRTYNPARHSDGSCLFVQDMSDGGSTAVPTYLTSVEVINEMDANTPGVYEITYKVTVGIDDDKETGVMRLIVVVTE